MTKYYDEDGELDEEIAWTVTIPGKDGWGMYNGPGADTTEEVFQYWRDFDITTWDVDNAIVISDREFFIACEGKWRHFTYNPNDEDEDDEDDEDEDVW